MARRNPTRPLPAGSFEERFNTGVLDPAKWVASNYSGAVGTTATNTGVMNPNHIDLSSGMLRLKLTQTGTAGVAVTSTGAEISTLNSFGYGTYDFVARMSSTSATPNGAGTNVSGTISALFNYGADSVTEIDFELEGVESRKNDLSMTSYRYAGIFYQGQATGTTSATLPAHIALDLIIGFAYRHDGTTPPTAPVGWTVISSTGASTTSFTCAYRVATDGNTASGTWTNATSVAFQVYRGCDISNPIGVFATDTASSATASYPALTLDDSSWQLNHVAAFGATAVASNIQNAPTGLTARSNVTNTGEIGGFDSNGELSVWTAQTVSLGGTSRWQTITIELNRQRNETGITAIENLYTGFNSYRIIWTATYIEYYVNGQLKRRHTDVIPTTPCPAFINHWGTDNTNFGGVATPGTDRYMYVSYFRFIPS